MNSYVLRSKLDRARKCLRPGRSLLVAATAIFAWTAGQVRAQAFTYEFNLSPCTPSSGSTAINVWLPSGAKNVRAVLLVPENTDMYKVATSSTIRSVAMRHKLAIIYMRRCPVLVGASGGTDVDTAMLSTILEKVADTTGIPDFRYAPWVTFGLSSVGHFPFYLIFKCPERVVAGVTWHGEVPHYPADSWARITDATIPYLCLVGYDEWASHWRVYVRPGLLYWRQRGWLTSEIAGYQVGHLDYPTGGFMTKDMMLQYIAKYVDAAVEARVPKDQYATTGPVTLNQIDPSTGYLLDPCLECMIQNRTTRPDTMIHRYSDVPAAARDSMFWTFTKELAVDWVHMHYGMYGDFYSFHGTLTSWGGRRPLTHGPSSADTDLPDSLRQTSRTCGAGPHLSTSTTDGGFEADMVVPHQGWPTVNQPGMRPVPHVRIKRTTSRLQGGQEVRSSILGFVNGADALLAAKIIAGDTAFKPEVEQIIAADVNLDGTVTLADLDQLQQRAVGAIARFDQGAAADPLDWIFEDNLGERYLLGRDFQISRTYPADDGYGYFGGRVPGEPCVGLPAFGNQRYIDLGNRILGVALGDVDVSWPGASGTATVNVALAGGSSIGVTVTPPAGVTSVDLELVLADAVPVTGVAAAQSVTLLHHVSGNTLRVTSHSPAGYGGSGVAFTLSATGALAASAGAAYVDGKLAGLTVDGQALSAKPVHNTRPVDAGPLRVTARTVGNWMAIVVSGARSAPVDVRVYSLAGRELLHRRVESAAILDAGGIGTGVFCVRAIRSDGARAACVVPNE